MDNKTKIASIAGELGIALPSGSNSLVGGSTGTKSFGSGAESVLISPVDGKEWIRLRHVSLAEAQESVGVASQAFLTWRSMPAPKRGELVRRIAVALREKKEPLAQLVSYEMGKPLEESRGEVQEMIDICDFAVGLSRQLCGQTMPSERFEHRMYEQYHPLGVVLIISAFNFPVAVWCWNAAIAWVCGNVCVWKPSEKTPVSALAVQRIVTKVFEKEGLPEGISSVLVADASISEQLVINKSIPLVSATGSVAMGKRVAQLVGARLGRSLLELGGNSAVLLSNKGRLDLAVRAVLFGATGTAGQRCTTTRRVIVHREVYATFKQRLVDAYKQLKIGNPLDTQYHLGPLLDHAAVQTYQKVARQLAQDERVTTCLPAALLNDTPLVEASGCYVQPAIYEMPADHPLLQEETFAPILYLVAYDDLKEAIALQNDVPQGLSSALISDDLQEVESFLNHAGSDCGIANINIGTSGAEIGGAFGGEKDTGGGREAGSDAWKAYMRRQTSTINYGKGMPLAQGIRFAV